jgi:hypothetical protein
VTRLRAFMPTLISTETASFAGRFLMEPTGFEPVTSCVQSRYRRSSCVAERCSSPESLGVLGLDAVVRGHGLSQVRAPCVFPEHAYDSCW